MAMSVQTNLEKYVEPLDFEDEGNLARGIKSGLMIMLPFYTVIISLYLLLRHQ